MSVPERPDPADPPRTPAPTHDEPPRRGHDQPDAQGVTRLTIGGAPPLPSREEFIANRPRAARGTPDPTVEELTRSVRPFLLGTPFTQFQTGRAQTAYLSVEDEYVRRIDPRTKETVGWTDRKLPGSKVIVARDHHQQPIGALRLLLEDGQPTILEVAVVPERRGRGLASELYEAAERAGYDVEAASGNGGLTEAGAALKYKRLQARARRPTPPPAAPLPVDAGASTRAALERLRQPSIPPEPVASPAPAPSVPRALSARAALTAGSPAPPSGTQEARAPVVAPPSPTAPPDPAPAPAPSPSHRRTAPPASSGTHLTLRIGLVVAVLAFGAVMLIVLAIGSMSFDTSSTDSASGPSALAVADIPPDILPIYLQAGQSRGLDWAYLAAIGKIETDHGRSNAPGVKSGVNAFGCCAGLMQFSVTGPGGGTWGAYGVDGNHDGQTSVYDPADAIPAAADYLKASGAPGDWDRAIFAYNHAAWYVADVKRQAQLYRDAAKSPTALQTGGATTQRLPTASPWLVAIPGTTARCDSRIARDVMLLMERYKLALGDCYAASGHEPDGEHPLGLATDLTPGPGGSWALVEHLARDLGWTETCAASGCAGTLPPPFRFIGYNGFPGHGDPAHAGANAHLHLSWAHSVATAGQPATIVQTLLKPGGP